MKAHFRTIWQRFPCTLRPQPPSSFTSSAPLKTFYPCDFRWLLSSIERHLHAYWFFFFLSLSLFILFFIWAILKSDGVQACSLPVVKSIFLKRVNYENPFFFISVKERWEGKLKKKKTLLNRCSRSNLKRQVSNVDFCYSDRQHDFTTWRIDTRSATERTSLLQRILKFLEKEVARRSR